MGRGSATKQGRFLKVYTVFLPPKPNFFISILIIPFPLGTRTFKIRNTPGDVRLYIAKIQ